MPARPQKPKYESKIARWLREAGYSQIDIAHTLHIARWKISQVLRSPNKHLTITNMWVVSGMVQRPFLEVLYACINHSNIRLHNELDETFEDMTGLGVDTISEPE